MSEQTSPKSRPSRPPSTPDPNQKYWVKNEFGRVWGPFPLETVGRVNVGKGEYRGRITVSTDGKQFQPISDFPAVLSAMEKAIQENAKRIAQAAAAAEREKRKAATGIADAEAAAARSPVIRAASADPLMDLNLDLPTPPSPTSVAPRTSTPPPPPVESSAPPAEGKLDTASMANLYGRVAGLQLTGKLIIDADGKEYAIFFKKGTPERVDVPHPGEALIEFLIKRQAAPEEGLRQALDLAGGPETDMLDTLVSLNLVPQANLFPLLGEYGVEMLSRALSLDSGTFRWTENVFAPPGAFALGRRWELLCKWARTVPRPVVRKRLGDKATRAVYPSSGAKVALADLQLNAQEARVAAAFNGTRSPAMIAMETAADPEMVYRIALLLAEIGSVSFGPELSQANAKDIDQPILEKVSAGAEPVKPAPIEGAAIGKVAVKSAAVQAPAVEAKPPLPPPPKPPPPKPPPPPPKKVTAPPSPKPAALHAPSPADDDLGALKALFEKWKKANHFEVMGVPESAAPADIKAAYLALARRYHPDTVSDPTKTDLRDAKADLLSRVNDAFHVLEEAKSRTEYSATLQSGGQVDVGPLLQAEEDFLRATILIKARKYADALDLLERAIKINPNELEFGVWRAYARFSLAKDKQSVYDEAMAECARVAKEMPACVAAHLFTANMAKIFGDAKKAEAAYRKVLELEPNNIDAKRELRGKV